MAALIKRPYGLPAGYSNARYSAPTKYLPWNGSLKTASPARAQGGASQTYNVASVPADLSTLIVTTPTGRVLTFQFLYAGSVLGAGNIGIPLPASGASTAAQVTTQILSVFNAGSATPLGGVLTPFTFIIGTTTATTFVLLWTVAGTPVAIGGTQATVTITATAAGFFAPEPVAPARFGRNYAFLHGV